MNKPIEQYKCMRCKGEMTIAGGQCHLCDGIGFVTVYTAASKLTYLLSRDKAYHLNKPEIMTKQIPFLEDVIWDHRDYIKEIKQILPEKYWSAVDWALANKNRRLNGLTPKPPYAEEETKEESELERCKAAMRKVVDSATKNSRAPRREVDAKALDEMMALL